jgi:type I restriction enzyme, S subunit
VSKIDDLIVELCPNGVGFKTLGEVGEFVRGSGLQKKHLTDQGVGAIHYGQVFTVYGTSANVTKSFVDPEFARRLRKASLGDLVLATTSENDEDVCKAVAWLGEDEIAISGDAYVYSHSLDPLYVAYFFQSDSFQSQKKKFITGTKVKRVSGAHLARVKIPIPPLAIQREIAEILTKMETLKVELEAKLEAELEYRSRQHAHYRDYLLSFAEKERVRWVPMGEVGKFVRGRRFTKGDVVPEGISSIHYGEIYTRYGVYADKALSRVRPELRPALRFAETGDVVIAAVGETVEDVCKAVAWMGAEDVAIHDDCYLFRHALNPKFVSYYFQTSKFNSEKDKYVARAKVKRISGESLAKMLIPVPPIEEQERIVAILDKFEALVSDFSARLSAEVKARRQQYEHYRDKLISFEEPI